MLITISFLALIILVAVLVSWYFHCVTHRKENISFEIADITYSDEYEIKIEVTIPPLTFLGWTLKLGRINKYELVSQVPKAPYVSSLTEAYIEDAIKNARDTNSWFIFVDYFAHQYNIPWRVVYDTVIRAWFLYEYRKKHPEKFPN